MKFCIVFPSGYFYEQKNYPTVYLLHGYNQTYKDWMENTELLIYSVNYDFIIITPEGKNSWYSNSISRENSKYKDYIVKDLVRFINEKYRTIARKKSRAIVELSMEGYGSAKLALKNDSLFFFVGCLSPAIHVPFGLADSSILKRRSKESMQSIR